MLLYLVYIVFKWDLRLIIFVLGKSCYRRTQTNEHSRWNQLFSKFLVYGIILFDCIAQVNVVLSTFLELLVILSNSCGQDIIFWTIGIFFLFVRANWRRRVLSTDHICCLFLLPFYSQFLFLLIYEQFLYFHQCINPRCTFDGKTLYLFV